MPNIIEITDFHAPELDPYARLTQNQLRNRLEPEKGIFIAESPKVIDRALDAGYKPVSLLMERKQITGPAAGILSRCGDAPVYTADREMLAELTGFELTRGVLCAFHRPAPRLVEELCKTPAGWPCWRASWTPPMWGHLPLGGGAEHGRCPHQPFLLRPALPPRRPRQHGYGVSGTLGAVGRDPGRLAGEGNGHPPLLGFKTAAMALSDRSVSIDDEQLAKSRSLPSCLAPRATASPPTPSLPATTRSRSPCPTAWIR